MNTINSASAPAARMSSFGLTTTNWIWIWLFGLVAGAFLYSTTVIGAYHMLLGSMRTAPLPQLRGYSGSRVHPEDALAIAKSFRVSSPDAVKDKLASVLSTIGSKGGVATVPASRLLVGLIEDNGRCAGDCNDGCIELQTARVLRRLAGWPSGSRLDLAATPVQLGGSGTETVDDRCKRVLLETAAITSTTDILEHPWGLLSREEPVPVPHLAEDLLRPGACEASSPDFGTCQLVIRTMQAIVDSDDVRFWRSEGVNAFYGFERLFVWVLVFASAAALWKRGRLFRPVAQRESAMQSALRDTAGGRPQALITAALSKVVVPAPRRAGGSNERRDSLAELVDTADQDMNEGATERNVGKIAELHLDEIESERLSIESMIAIFPVIGFVATLLGLIEALASANTIATTTGDDRGAAILHVTSALSSCFATTLLALVAMAGFSVWNMIQGRREKNLIRTVELSLSRLVALHWEGNQDELSRARAALRDEQDLMHAEELHLAADEASLHAQRATERAKRLREEEQIFRNRRSAGAGPLGAPDRLLVPPSDRDAEIA